VTVTESAKLWHASAGLQATNSIHTNTADLHHRIPGLQGHDCVLCCMQAKAVSKHSSIFSLGVLFMQEEKDIGIVTAIAAPAALEVKFFGDGGHAGAQLMPLRWVGGA